MFGLLFREGWEKVRVGGIERVGAVGGVGSDAQHASPSQAGSGVAGAGAVTESSAVSTAHGRGQGAHAGTYSVSAAGTVDGAVNREAVEDIVQGLNQALKAADKRLQFLVHETTGRIYVKVINQETEEVIKEIPPEKILDLVGHLQELVGLLVDEKV